MEEKAEQEYNEEAPAEEETRRPFAVRDCSLIALATGIRVQNLKEFRDGLVEAHPGSIYHHFWGRLLQPRFDEPEYNNDFAAWAYHGLHEKALAERLSVVDPSRFDSIDDVRTEIVDIVEERLDESELIPWARADRQFYFMRSQIVVLDTGLEVHDPGELAGVMHDMSLGSVFYHFIDARRRTHDHADDFSLWIEGFGEACAELKQKLQEIDPFFSSLKEIRRMLTEILESCGDQVAATGGAS